MAILLTGGMRWGRVEYLGSEYRDVERSDNGVTEFYSDLVYLLRCDCGETFEVPKSEWKGKRVHSDCGCGLADTSPRERIGAVVFVDDVHELRQLWKGMGTSFNQFLLDALREGLEHVQPDDESTRTQNIVVYGSEEMKEELKTKADKLHMSVSQLVREALNHGVRKKRDRA